MGQRGNAIDPLEVILRQVSDGITTLSPDGRLRYANLVAARLCGYDSAEEMIADNGAAALARFELFAEDGARLPLERTPTRLALTGQMPSEQLLRWRNRATGEDRWSRVRAVPVVDATGTVELVVNLFRDVTEQHRQEEKKRLLDRASALFATSLDAPVTLQRLASLVLASLADWCVLHVEQEGHPPLRVIKHADPDKTRWAEEIDRRWPPRADDLYGPPAVQRSGEPELYPDISDEGLALGAYDDEHLAVLRTVGMRSYLCVPLHGLREPIGTMMFVSAESARRYDEADLAVAQELADRTAAFVENARLYREAQAERALAERHATHQRLLAEAARHFAAASTDSGRLLDEITRRVAESIGDACSIRTLSADGTLHEHRATWAADPAARALARHPSAIAARPAQDGLFGQILRTGEPIIAASVDREALAAQYAAAGLTDVLRQLLPSSIALFPLRAGGQVFGVLAASRLGAAAPYGADELRALEELTDLAALTLENARLYAGARQAEAERADLLRREQEANRAKDEFLAMLGHELRNPLAPMLTALELMNLRLGDQAQREREVIARQTHHLVRLVDDLLDVSRITRGKIELKRRPLELASAVDSALETAGPLLEQRRHHVVCNVPREGLRVDADEARLAQVIANLLTNAAKYTDPGGHIEIVASERGGQAVLRVRDDGAGITPELRPRLFDLFAQGARTLDRAQGGLGLGLAIVQSLVQLHGGSVEAHSEGSGRGSEFVIQLPLAAAGSTRPVLEAGPPATTAAGGGRRILIVDDNEDAAEVLSELLGTVGHTTRAVWDGPSALEAAPSFAPEVAVLDIGLPVMNGYELADRLRALPGLADLKLIALTGYGQSADRARSRAAGFHAHLVKPVDWREVDLTIRELLRVDVARAL